METIKDRVRAALAQHFDDLDDIELNVPEDPAHGDLATNAAMQAAGQRGMNPRELAENVASELETAGIEGIESVEVAGPGFINFHADRIALGQKIVDHVADLAFDDRDEKIIVEHTSPNPNKPLHMGTMRCAILGDTIARLGERLGYTVEVQNLINDLGRQSATTVYAYRNFLDELTEDEQNKKADFWVGLLYSEAAQYIDTHPDENKAVGEIINNIEDGDNETTALKDDLVEKSVRGQLQTAYRSNVTYNAMIFERDIIAAGLYEEGIEKLKELDNVYRAENREDKGCIVIDLSMYEDELGDLRKPYKILIRSDGTATYVAKDIVLTMWKFGLLETEMEFSEFVTQPNGEPLWASGGDQEKDFGGGDRIINVIGAEQKYPQTIIRYCLKALGFDDAFENFGHTHFKFVYLPGKVAYSGREGNWVGKHGDAVLEKAYELALDEVQTRHDDMPTDEQEHIAEQVAVAAVRYFLLRFTREKDIDFSFEKALNWEGDSGPYLQYSLARAHGILQKVDADPAFSTYEQDAEIALLKYLSTFPDVLEAAFEAQEPAKIANFLKHAAEDFNSFYHAAPVKDAESEELKRSRLAIVQAYTDVMEQGLAVLGIEPLEKM